MSYSPHTNSTNDDTTIVTCANCGHNVPTCNMALHLARHCGNRDNPHLLSMSDPQCARAPPTVHGMETDDNAYSVIDLSSPSPSSSPSRQALNDKPNTSSTLYSNTVSFNSPPENRDVARMIHSSPHVNTSSFRSDGSTDVKQSSNRYRRRGSNNETISTTRSSRESVPIGGAKTTGEDGQEVVNLMSDDVDDDSHGRDELEEEDNDVDLSVEEQWECPRCTLLNSTHAPCCGACQYQNNSSNHGIQGNNGTSDTTSATTRPPDRVRRERLIEQEFEEEMRRRGRTSRQFFISGGNGENNTPTSNGVDNNENIGGSNPNDLVSIRNSALLGSAIGAAASYYADRSVASGAIEGAVAGAVGGALSRAYSNGNSPSQSPPTTNPPVSSSISSLDHDGRQIRLIRQSNGRGGFSSHIIPSSGDFVRRQRISLDDPNIINTLLQSLINESSTGNDLSHRQNQLRMQMMMNNGNMDNMSYENLLDLFGDGSENRGADQRTINHLPTAVIRDIDNEIPSEHRQCAICLEDFKNGDVRKTMPCLHGFHEGCINQWLTTNGSCPICKHRL